MNSNTVNGATLNGGPQRYVSGSATFVGAATFLARAHLNVSLSAQFVGRATFLAQARRNYGAFDPCERSMRRPCTMTEMRR